MPANSTNRGINSGQWSTKLAVKPTNICLACCAAVNGVIYTVGGISTGAVSLATNESYTISTNTWATLTSMTIGAFGNSVCAIGNYIYSCGGFNGGALPYVYRYNISGNTWSPTPPTAGYMASMPAGRFYGNCVGIGTKIWYIGGTTDSVNGNTNVWSFETTTPTTSWVSSYTGIPTGRWGHGLTAIGTKIYLLGGWNQTSSAIDGTLYSYETTTNTWATLTSAPTTFRYFDYGGQYLFAYGNYLYALYPHSSTATGTATSSDLVMLRYDTAANSWSIVNEAPALMCEQYATISGSSIYVLNGSATENYTIPTNITYQYKLPI